MRVRTDELRQAILAAAWDVFRENGFDRTTMSEIFLLSDKSMLVSVSDAIVIRDRPHSSLTVTITFSGGRPSLLRSRTRTRTAVSRTSGDAAARLSLFERLGDPAASITRSNAVRTSSSSLLRIEISECLQSGILLSTRAGSGELERGYFV